jgi:ABC-2 type transport system permease protein
VTDLEVVLGKWLGCWLVYLVMLAPTLIYVVLLRVYGHPDLGPLFSNYLGLALVGAMYVSVGIMASAMTRNQVIAGVLSLVILLIFALLGPWIASVLPTPYRTFMQLASVQSHYQDFAAGVVDLVHVIYFVVLTAYMLFFTVKILESRRWR